jgi:catechol 2,3-dioxygenase-like lactoylglutathione lyase family enzyme
MDASVTCKLVMMAPKEGIRMQLNLCRVEAVAAVSNLDRAKEFYEHRLGLVPDADEEGGVRYPCADGSAIFIYLAPENAGGSQATVAGWFVDDLEGTINELVSRGVALEHYNQPDIKTSELGIFDNGRLRAAWIKDPDGNTIALTQIRR